MTPFWNRRRETLLLLAILLFQGLLLLWAATRHAPPSDETGHLVAGLSHWRTGHFDLYRVNPPLVRVVATLPLAAAGLREPPTRWDPRPGHRPEFALGRDFIRQHGERAFWYFTVARWACLPFAFLGGYICYRWARELYGLRSGLFAAALWAACPLVLAHAQMITPDTGATAFGTLACYLFWRWLKQPGWPHAYWAGLGLGVALLCKTIWILLFFLWPLLWVVARLSQRPRAARHDWLVQFGQFALLLVVCVGVINAGYLFEGSFHRLDEFPFISKALTVEREPGERENRFVGTWLAGVPVPLPRNFVSGIDVQKKEFENGFWSYLRGEWRHGGWWYYYLYGLAVKWPVGSWLLLLLAGCSTLVARTRSPVWREEWFLAAHGVGLFTFVSSQTGFNHHLRYILPALPFAFIWMSRVFEIVRPRPMLWSASAPTALLCSATSSLLVYPHSLSYFNELAGGPRNGSAHLVDSNLDWGQDLLYLKHWLDKHPEASPLGLAYFGNLDPRVAGIDFSPPPKGRTRGIDPDPNEQLSAGPRPGWFAVSATLLRGHPSSIPDGKGGWTRTEMGCYEYFQHFEPVAMAGYSIFIFHIERAECNRVRSLLGLPKFP